MFLFWFSFPSFPSSVFYFPKPPSSPKSWRIYCFSSMVVKSGLWSALSNRSMKYLWFYKDWNTFSLNWAQKGSPGLTWQLCSTVFSGIKLLVPLSPGYDSHSHGPKGSSSHHIQDSSGEMEGGEKIGQTHANSLLGKFPGGLTDSTSACIPLARI